MINVGVEMVFDFHGSTRSPAIEMEVSGLTDLADRKNSWPFFQPPCTDSGTWHGSG